MKKYAFFLALFALCFGAQAKEPRYPTYGFRGALMVPQGNLVPFYKNGFTLDWSRMVHLGKKKKWIFREGFQYSRLMPQQDSIVAAEFISWNNGFQIEKRILVQSPIEYYGVYFEFNYPIVRTPRLEAYLGLGGKFDFVSIHDKIYGDENGVQYDTRMPVSFGLKTSLLVRYRINERLFYIAEGNFVPSADAEEGENYSHYNVGFGINYSLHED